MRNEKLLELPSLRRLSKQLRPPMLLMNLKQSYATEHYVRIPSEVDNMVSSPPTQATPTSAKSYGGQPIARTLRQACAERSRSAQDDTQASALSALCVLTLRSLRSKHAVLLIAILLITNIQTNAQSPYTGGTGDGHAMGVLQLRSVAVNELSTTDGYQIYPALAKAGETIYITSPVAGEIQIIDITGRTIHTQTIEQPAQQLPVVVTQAGLCIGIIRTQAGTFTQKIIVVE